MKDSNRMPECFALPADLERAKALNHIGPVKRVCIDAIHIAGLGCEQKMELLKQRFEVVLLTMDSVK